MPSHRKQRVPRHGAQRRTENPSRRAWLNAAVPAPDPVLETSQPVVSQPALETQWSAFVAAAEADLSPTAPIMLIGPDMLPSVSRADPVPVTPHHSARDGAVLGGASAGGAAALRPPPGPPGPSWEWRVRRAVRGLLMTPSFAAVTGIVIA